MLVQIKIINIFCVPILNKRAMMALDRSPESFPHNMNSTFFVTIVPTCDPLGGGQF